MERAWSRWHPNKTGGSPKWSGGSGPGWGTSFAGACPTRATPRMFCRTSSTKLVEANRLLMPIDHVTGWLFRVARNRITDLFRKKKPERFGDIAVADEDDERLQLEDLLPSPDAGPEALYARNVLLEELELAIDELPKEQRDVFVALELEGRRFKEMAAETGVSLNTLLSRKRYAVRHLR
jgi:RNA polymerase sigma factor (sigma-70 family)